MESKFLGSTGLAKFLENLYNVFSTVGHTHTKSQITDFPTIPTSVSQLTNDIGYITADNNTTYTLTKDGDSIVLAGSDGTTQTIEDFDTIIPVDSELSADSENPVQNKVINIAISNLTSRIDDGLIDIDGSLSVEGMAADAKAVGDVISEIQPYILDIDYDAILAFDTSEVIFGTNTTSSVLGQAILGQMVLA